MNRGAISPALSLAILLGADVGTTVVVQLFSQRLEWLSPLLIFFGVVRFLTSERTRQRNLGRAALGLGLVLLALQIISAGSQPLASSDGMKVVISHLGNEPLLTILLIAGITVLLHSSVAVVLLVAALTTSHVISLEQAILMVLGANLGGAMLPVLATYAMSNEARCAPLANATVRFLGVAVFAAFPATASTLLSDAGLEYGDCDSSLSYAVQFYDCAARLSLYQPSHCPRRTVIAAACRRREWYFPEQS